MKSLKGMEIDKYLLHLCDTHNFPFLQSLLFMHSGNTNFRLKVPVIQYLSTGYLLKQCLREKIMEAYMDLQLSSCFYFNYTYEVGLLPN